MNARRLADLAAMYHADPGAQMPNRASRAPWRDGLTDCLAKRDQKRIVFDPVTPRQFFTQRLFAFFGAVGFNQTPAVGDPVNVGVNTDAGFAKRLGHNEVGGLAANSVERQQVIEPIRHLAAEAYQQIAADLQNNPRFSPIKTNGKNQPFDFFLRQLQHLRRSVGAREKTWGRKGRSLVLGPQAQDAADQREEGIAPLRGH